MNILENIAKLEREASKYNEAHEYNKALLANYKSRTLILKNMRAVSNNVIGCHITNRMTYLLNNNDFIGVKQEIHLFDKIMNGRKVAEKILFRRYLSECDVELRTGNFDKVIAVAGEALKIIKSNEFRCHLYIEKGKAELENNHDSFQVTSLSNALAEAESSGNSLLIGLVYMELSRMFSTRYLALGIYFLRKAEVIYKRGGYKYELNNEYMYRAMASMVLYERKGQSNSNGKIFKKEAERLVGKIDARLFRLESDKWYYQRLKAYIFKEEDLLEDVLEFYKKIGSKPEIARTSEIYIGICLNKGLNDKVRTMLPIYKEACSDNAEKLENIEKLEDMMQKNQHVVYESPFDGAEKEPTLFDVLDKISLGEENWALNESKFRVMFPSYMQEGLFEATGIQNNKTSLIPCSISINCYYRGQNEYFEECKASLYRRGLTEADKFVERLKYAELKLLIKSHPIQRIYEEGFVVTHPDGSKQPIYLNVDYLALAQHYGIKTELLDLTVDKFVAAFFACTDYNNETDSYSIHKGNEGYGVFYKYSNANIYMPSLSHINAQNLLRVVGLQPFPRPGEQAGYALEMGKDDNFNSLSPLIKFKHDENVAKFIFNYTNRQKRLFPGDILDSKIPLIKKGNKFSRQALELAIKEYYQRVDKDTIERYLRDKGVSICESPIINFTKQEIDEFNKNWEARDRQRFCDKVIARSVFRP